MTPEEKTLKIADLAIAAGRYKRQRDAALAACGDCPVCAGKRETVEGETGG